MPGRRPDVSPACRPVPGWPGVAVVIADLTTTRFCDSAGLRHLLQAHRHAVGTGVQLRLVIPPRGPVGRVIELTGINRHVPVYPTLQLATDDSLHR